MLKKAESAITSQPARNANACREITTRPTPLASSPNARRSRRALRGWAAAGQYASA
jgi:hypothetical protein